MDYNAVVGDFMEDYVWFKKNNKWRAYLEFFLMFLFALGAAFKPEHQSIYLSLSGLMLLFYMHIFLHDRIDRLEFKARNA